MERLLESGTLTDVSIKCEDRILECHKVSKHFSYVFAPSGAQGVSVHLKLV